ncbi:bidirectional sugar transporter SWEET15 [Oryza brachyantha]|uniref:Bidirectional sugar transporter SWEET n=1 Tax=Oryza brachyantha TaxID=4533 RepID=J3LD74_ORYBR|nr:bidirectional sugar transporter SWEET15 [Oryza brachyantha]
MAFLSMERNTWAFTFGILGNIISLMVFLSPLPTFYRVYRKKSTEGFQSTPYVVTLFSCMLWMYYAFVKSGAELLVTINGVGCVIETVYLAMYLAYAAKSTRMLTTRMLLGLNVGLFGLIALVTLLLPQGALRVHVLGWVCVAVSLSVFAAPLSIIRLVIRTKSVEFMPFSLSFFLVLSAVIWFGYGLLKKDVFVALPNVLGFVFGVAQMALYMAYRTKKPPASSSSSAAAGQEIKLPEHVKEVTTIVAKAGAAPPEGRASCGAEVHPIDDALPAPTVVEVKVDEEANRTDGVDVDDGDHGILLRPEQIIKPDMAIVVEV